MGKKQEGTKMPVDLSISNSVIQAFLQGRQLRQRQEEQQVAQAQRQQQIDLQQQKFAQEQDRLIKETQATSKYRESLLNLQKMGLIPKIEESLVTGAMTGRRPVTYENTLGTILNAGIDNPQALAEMQGSTPVPEIYQKELGMPEEISFRSPEYAMQQAAKSAEMLSEAKARGSFDVNQKLALIRSMVDMNEFIKKARTTAEIEAEYSDERAAAEATKAGLIAKAKQPTELEKIRARNEGRAQAKTLKPEILLAKYNQSRKGLLPEKAKLDDELILMHDQNNSVHIPFKITADIRSGASDFANMMNDTKLLLKVLGENRLGISNWIDTIKPNSRAKALLGSILSKGPKVSRMQGEKGTLATKDIARAEKSFFNILSGPKFGIETLTRFDRDVRDSYWIEKIGFIPTTSQKIEFSIAQGLNPEQVSPAVRDANKEIILIEDSQGGISLLPSVMKNPETGVWEEYNPATKLFEEVQ